MRLIQRTDLGFDYAASARLPALIRKGSSMLEPGRSRGSNGGRRSKRFLSPSQKHEIGVGLLRGEYTTIEAADRAGVGRSTIMRLRQVAKQGALEAL